MIVEMVSVGYGALSMASWGCGDFMAKRLVAPLGYYKVLLYTQLVGLAPLFLLAVMFTPPLPSSLRAIALTFGTGICSVSSLFFFYKGLSIGKASIITPVASTSAIVAMALSFVILGETLTILQIMCLALVVTGILFLSVIRSSTGELRERGLLYALGCMIAAGLNSILIKLLSYDIGEIGTLFFNRVLVTVILLVIFQLYRKKFTQETKRMVSLKVIVATGLIEFVGYFGYIVGVSVGFGLDCSTGIQRLAGSNSPSCADFLEGRVTSNSKTGNSTCHTWNGAFSNPVKLAAPHPMNAEQNRNSRFQSQTMGVA